MNKINRFTSYWMDINGSSHEESVEVRIIGLFFLKNNGWTPNQEDFRPIWFIIIQSIGRCFTFGFRLIRKVTKFWINIIVKPRTTRWKIVKLGGRTLEKQANIALYIFSQDIISRGFVTRWVAVGRASCTGKNRGWTFFSVFWNEGRVINELFYFIFSQLTSHRWDVSQFRFLCLRSLQSCWANLLGIITSMLGVSVKFSNRIKMLTKTPITHIPQFWQRFGLC